MYFHSVSSRNKSQKSARTFSLDISIFQIKNEDLFRYCHGAIVVRINDVNVIRVACHAGRVIESA